jgi:hypothetical protein
MESLKAQRERVARELCAKNYGHMYSPHCNECSFAEPRLRELQRAAMEAVIAHIGGIEFSEGSPEKPFLRGWLVAGTDSQVWAKGVLSIDALLDEKGADDDGDRG